jgi:outer membrane immunogenic protein
MGLKIAALVVAAGSLAVAQIASAADMPVKAPVYKAPPMAAATPWTGFYVNGGFGYGMWAADTTVLNSTGSVCNTCVTEVQGGKGWLATIGAGYDYQFTSRIVAGLFGDASLSALKGDVQDGQPFRVGEIKQTSSWAAGVRAGWLVSMSTLGYVNAGYTGARFSGADMADTRTGASLALSTPATTFNGWFLGGGVETALAPGWFLRTEYRYAYYGSKNLQQFSPAGTPNDIFTFKPTVQTVTAQVVYKFNPGLPAPAYSPIPAKPTKWTGFYVNGGWGYGLWAADTTTVNSSTGICVECLDQRQGGKGYLGVIGAGYDWQFAPAWVVGVFGDFDLSSLKGTVQDQTGTGPDAVAGDIKQTSAWAIGPRLGWLPEPQTMTYVNGGYTGARFSSASMIDGVTGVDTGHSTPATTFNGWFVGGGVETSFDFFGMLGKGWFWRNEYRYASYSGKTLTDTNGVGGAFNSITFKPVVQTITSEIIFKLN